MNHIRKLSWLFPFFLLTACSIDPEPTARSNMLEPQSDIIRVTTTEHEFNNDGDCSLREAIVAANRQNWVDGCAGGGTGRKTIVLEEGATYLLSTEHRQVPEYDSRVSALPVVTGGMIVEGNGATLKGSAGDGQYLNLLTVGYEGKLTLKNLTLTGGRTRFGGAAIQNYGNLFGEYVTVTSNVSEDGAGGIENSGILDFSHCKFIGNHSDEGTGAVYSSISNTYYEHLPESKHDYVHFDQCLFENNTTNTGVAAITNSGKGRMTLERSAVVNNRVKQYIFSSTTPERIPAIIKNNSRYEFRNGERLALNLENVTLSQSLGPVYFTFANFTTARVTHSTIYKNHSTINANRVAGLYNGFFRGDKARLEIGHTVVADHEPRDVQGGATWGDCHGNLPVSLGYNFQSDGSCKFGATGDIQAHPHWAALVPLGYNGGFTPTHEPVPIWSKLWDAGDVRESTRHGTDQRGSGNPRKDGNEVDIGAHETCSDNLGVFWFFFIPFPYCQEEQETMSLSVPLSEVPLEKRLEPDMYEIVGAPCDYCTLGIGVAEPGALHFALQEEAFERAQINAVLLYNADGEVVAEGERGLEARLEPGRYFLEIVGEGEEGTELPAIVALRPL